MLRTFLLSLTLVTGMAMASPNVSVTLQPVNLTGQPGETVRWNLSIEMLLPDRWAVINSIQLYEATPIGFFDNSGLANWYTIWPTDLAIGPGNFPTIQPFVFNNFAGSQILEYTIDSNAQPGDVSNAFFVFSFAVYTKDPNNDFFFDADLDFFANDDVYVEDVSISVPLSEQVIPEPSTLGVFTAGLALIGFLKTKR